MTIDVTGPMNGEWMVTVAHERASVASYAMGAVTVNGAAVPTVSSRPLPAPSMPHHPYCAGDQARITALLERLATDRTQAADVTIYGRWLFQCLLDPAWEQVRQLPAVRVARGVELALRWPVTAGSLHDLLWEAMHDGAAPLAGHPELLVAITRVVPCDVPAPTTIKRAPRVLLAAGSDLTDEVIRPGAMFMGLLRSAESEGLCMPRVAQHVTAGQLEEMCRHFQPDFVQLVAHGDLAAHEQTPEGLVRGRGVLRMALGRPGGGVVGAEQLLPALTAGGSVTQVVLCACRSGAGFAPTGALPLAVELVCGGIPVVVAMTGDVSEQACRLWTRRMTASLHAGEPLVEAAARGRRAALIGTEQPGDHIDWAMPALFVASSVDTRQPLVDPTPSTRVAGIARNLELAEYPVFIGRIRELDVLDEMSPKPKTAPGAWRVGCVILRSKGSIRAQGATRLLREMGHRLLHRGHIPLLMGPYETAPASLREVVANLLDRMALFAEVVGLDPPQSWILRDAGLTPPDTSLPLHLRRVDLNRQIAKFRGHTGLIAPGDVRPLLEADLAAFRAAAAAAGPPFGAHTTPIVLADEVHRWTGAIGDTLSLIGSSGLGTTDVIPVILTGSEQGYEGARLKDFVDDNSKKPGVRTFDLIRLEPKEAAMGFLWVLLNPWGEHSNVYTASRRTKVEDLTNALEDSLRGLPTAVEGPLYVVARALAGVRNLIPAQDEDAYRQFAEHYR